MNPKRIVTVLLLVFVAVSVIALVRKERAVQNAAAAPEHVDGDDAAVADPASAVANDQVVVYYFHGTMRCVTCRRIEAYAKEAVESSFGAELEDGRLVWREVDVESPGNGHFVTDFELATRSVVVARYHGGERREWKRLDRVWQLVGDKPAFLDFVRAETAALLKEPEA